MPRVAKHRQVTVHSQKEIAGIRAAARKTAEVRERLRGLIRPGVTTLDFDRLAGDLIRATGGESAFAGYHGFPGQICISLNDEVVHGVGRPGRVIAPGDIVSIDVGVRFNGFVGDTALTACAGEVAPSPLAGRLLETTWQALQAGVRAACAGAFVNDISRAVQTVAETAGFSVVRDFVGHGCGCQLHEPPEVPNYAQSKRGPRLRPGMVLAIEPMVNAGTPRVKIDNQDGWTVRTQDGSLSAHFEHMVLITKGKPEILTWPKMLSG